jgi:putative membrane protein
MTSEPTGQRRLHPAEILLAALDNVRELLIAAVAGLVVGGGASSWSPVMALLIGSAGVMVVLVVGYLRWSTTLYWVAQDAVHLRTGIVSPDETSVPLARIQAIDTTQGPVQRLFGVHELHVQTAGGGAKGEIVLRAVSEHAARELRTAAGLAEPATRELPEWRLSAGGLVAAALTTPQIGVLLPLVGGLVALFDDLLLTERGNSRLIDRLPDDPAGIALLGAALAAATLLVSFLGAVVAFSGFTLVRDGQRLQIRRGLIQRRAASIPLGRVHAVEVVESLARRPFGLAAVRVETAGYRSEAAAAQTLFPLVRLADLPALLAEFVPALAGTFAPLEGPPARARRRYALVPTLTGAALGAAVTLALGDAWPAILVLAALGAAWGLLRHRSAGWRLDGRRVVVRQGALARRTLIARSDRLQEHGLSASVLQSRAELADVAVAVGSGRTGRVRHLESDVAGQLFERLRRARARLRPISS